MNPTGVGTMFSSFVAAIGSILTTNLPLVLAIAAGLIGLGILVLYVRRWIGGRGYDSYPAGGTNWDEFQ